MSEPDTYSVMHLWGMRPANLTAIRTILLVHHIEDYETYSKEGKQEAAEASIEDLKEVLDEIGWDLDKVRGAFRTEDDFLRFAGRLENVPGIGN